MIICGQPGNDKPFDALQPTSVIDGHSKEVRGAPFSRSMYSYNPFASVMEDKLREKKCFAYVTRLRDMLGPERYQEEKKLMGGGLVELELVDEGRALIERTERCEPRPYNKYGDGVRDEDMDDMLVAGLFQLFYHRQRSRIVWVNESFFICYMDVGLPREFVRHISCYVEFNYQDNSVHRGPPGWSPKYIYGHAAPNLTRPELERLAGIMFKLLALNRDFDKITIQSLNVDPLLSLPAVSDDALAYFAGEARSPRSIRFARDLPFSAHQWTVLAQNGNANFRLEVSNGCPVRWKALLDVLRQDSSQGPASLSISVRGHDAMHELAGAIRLNTSIQQLALECYGDNGARINSRELFSAIGASRTLQSLRVWHLPAHDWERFWEKGISVNVSIRRLSVHGFPEKRRMVAMKALQSNTVLRRFTILSKYGDAGVDEHRDPEVEFYMERNAFRSVVGAVAQRREDDLGHEGDGSTPECRFRSILHHKHRLLAADPSCRYYLLRENVSLLVELHSRRAVAQSTSIQTREGPQPS